MNYIKLSDVDIEFIKQGLRPVELQLLLYLEDYTDEVDIMLENMMHFFLEEEMYEHCAIIRDEIERRKLISI